MLRFKIPRVPLFSRIAKFHLPNPSNECLKFYALRLIGNCGQTQFHLAVERFGRRV